MTRTAIRVLAAAAIAAIAGAGAAPSVAEEALSYQPLATPLFAGGETVIGQAIAYPDGTAKVTAVIVTIPPGGETGWHMHPVPLYVHVLDGAVTVDYGDKGVKTFAAGESILEAMDWPHNGRNDGDRPVRILAVYIGAEGIDNAVGVAE